MVTEKLEQEFRAMARKAKREVEDQNAELEKAAKDRDMKRFLEAVTLDMSSAIDKTDWLKTSIDEIELRTFTVGMPSKCVIERTDSPHVVWPTVDPIDVYDGLFGTHIQPLVLPSPTFDCYQIPSLSRLAGLKRANRTLIAATPKSLSVWSVPIIRELVKEQIPAFTFAAVHLNLDPSCYYVDTFDLLEASNVWYRAEIKYETIDGRTLHDKKVVFKNLHEHLWNYVALAEIDFESIKNFNIRILEVDPMTPLSEYETKLAIQADVIKTVLPKSLVDELTEDE